MSIRNVVSMFSNSRFLKTLKVTLSERGEIKKPPLKVFNSVVNTCEICKEEELTLLILETMKK